VRPLPRSGCVTKLTLTNGILTGRGYDPVTGWLESIDTTKGGTAVQDNTYAWQSNGVLESRLKQVGSTVYQEVFEHDGLNRLETSRTYVNSVLSRTLSNAYDLRGNLTSKTSDILSDVDVTAYTPVAGRNRLQSATIGGVATTFAADANGNLTRYDRATGDDKFIDWNARNLPISVVIGSSPTDPTPTARDTFAYGPDRQRFYKQSTWDDNGTQKTEHTFYVGAFEERITDSSHPTHKSVQKVRVGQSIVLLAKTSWSNQVTRSVEYLHRDHLGSIEAVTDSAGNTVATFGFDPFGGRRTADWSRALTPAETLALADSLEEPAQRGYTDHEMLDRTGLIHMNGRVYDAEIGRFLSPDPHVTYPTFSQSYNRYAYVLNSPMAMTDPSGLDGVPAHVRRNELDEGRPGLGGTTWGVGFTGYAMPFGGWDAGGAGSPFDGGSIANAGSGGAATSQFDVLFDDDGAVVADEVGETDGVAGELRSTILHPSNLAVVFPEFVQYHPLEFMLFVTYASELNLPSVHEENFYKELANAWEDFTPWVTSKSAGEFGTILKNEWKSIYGPESFAKKIGLRGLFKYFDKPLLDATYQAYSKARKTYEALDTVDKAKAAGSLLIFGPQIINEGGFYEIHGRPYPRHEGGSNRIQGTVIPF